MKYLIPISLIMLVVVSGCNRSIQHHTPYTPNISSGTPYAKYKYFGVGQYSELERSYTPYLKTRGFIISMPEFIPKADIYMPFFLEVLPDQIEKLHIDLALLVPKVVLSEEEEVEVLDEIPKNHSIRCTLSYSDTGALIAYTEKFVKDFSRMKNRKLRRNFILNLLEIEPGTIENGRAVELTFKYHIGGKPINNNMMVIVTMNPPTAYNFSYHTLNIDSGNNLTAGFMG